MPVRLIQPLVQSFFFTHKTKIVQNGNASVHPLADIPQGVGSSCWNCRKISAQHTVPVRVFPSSGAGILPPWLLGRRARRSRLDIALSWLKYHEFSITQYGTGPESIGPGAQKGPVLLSNLSVCK